MEEFRKARRQGHAIMDQELEDGLVAASVPLRDCNGVVLAAVNVCGHASQLTLDDLERRCLPALARVRAPNLALAGLRRCRRRFAAPFRSGTPRALSATALSGFVLWADPDSMKSRAELQQEVAAAERGVEDRTSARRGGAIAVRRSRHADRLHSAFGSRGPPSRDCRDVQGRGRSRSLARSRRYAGAGPALSRFRNPREGWRPRSGANALSSICARKFAVRLSAACAFPASLATSRHVSASGCARRIF